MPIDLGSADACCGFTLGPPRPQLPRTQGTEHNIFIVLPPDAQDTAYVASLLALGTSPEPSGQTNTFVLLVNGWHQPLRRKNLIAATVRTNFRASLPDTSIPLFFWADRLQAIGLRRG